MNSRKGYEKLKHIFENNLSVDLLAEELFTCSLEDNAEKIKEEMQKKNYDIYGVELMGKAIGYVKSADLTKGRIKDFYLEFTSEELISDSTSLIELLDILLHRPYIFILEKSNVSKIVTIADLHKQPMRMLAFSFVSLLEMYITSLIEELYPENSWKALLPENRLTMAKNIWKDRLVKNEALSLLDSTQLADKGIIVKETPILMERLELQSKRKCKEFFKNVEYLRNNTAHSQKTIYHDNKELIKILLKIKAVLETNVFPLRQ